MAEEFGAQKNAIARLRDYISDVRIEMKRVTWPGKQEIYGTTVMVILTTFFFGIYFWFCDQVFLHAMAKVMKVFLHGG